MTPNLWTACANFLADHPGCFALLKGSALLAVAGCVYALVLRTRGQAALRHAVLLGGICLALAIPLAGTLVPAFLRIQVAAAPMTPGQPAMPNDTPTSGVAQNTATTRSTTPSKTANHLSAAPAAPPTETFTAKRGIPFLDAAWRQVISGNGLLVLWLAGGLAVLLPTLFAHARLATKMRRARPVRDARILGILARETAGSAVRVHLCTVPGAGDVPATFGLPPLAFVILPEEALRWTDEELRLVFAHELAHVARKDWAFACLAQVALAAHWFNPAAWWIRRQLSVEAECACDDRVLRSGARPSAYADLLLDLAGRFPLSPVPAWASPALPFTSSFSRRILMLLDPSRDRAPLSRKTLALVASLALFAGGLSAGVGLSAAAETPVASPSKPGEDDANQAAAHRLEKTLEQVDFNHDSLETVLAFLQDASGAKIAPSWPELEAAGIKRDHPVNLRLKHVSAQAVLKCVLESAAPAGAAKEKRPGYAFEKGEIKIKPGLGMPAPADAKKAAAANQATARLLEKNIERVDLEADSLETSLNFVRDVTGANVVVAWQDLEAAGIKRDSPVTLSLEHVSANELVVHVLAFASPAKPENALHATTTFEDGILKIGAAAAE